MSSKYPEIYHMVARKLSGLIGRSHINSITLVVIDRRPRGPLTVADCSELVCGRQGSRVSQPVEMPLDTEKLRDTVYFLDLVDKIAHRLDVQIVERFKS